MRCEKGLYTHLVLAAGRPMTREEVEAQIGVYRLTGLPFWHGGFKYRVLGDATGLQAAQTLSLAEVKQAWRNGAARSSPRWRAIFLMLGGGVVMVFGGLGIAVTAGPAFVQLLTAGAVVLCGVATGARLGAGVSAGTAHAGRRRPRSHCRTDAGRWIEERNPSEIRGESDGGAERLL
jgi:hypothetical protein